MLKLHKVKKKFKKKTVLRDVSITVNENECYCLVGKNGAGKSTIINIIIDILSYDEGIVELFDTNYEEDPIYIKKNIGVLPEFNPVIEEFTGMDYLKYVGLIYEIQEQLIEKRIRLLIQHFFEDGLEMDKKIDEYSRGMKIKIGICAAIIHKPKILILDEPFENLDPVASKILANFLIDYRKQGNCILVSSHDMNYVEKIATHIGVLHNTQIIFGGVLKELMKQSNNQLDDYLTRILGHSPKTLIDY